MEKDDLQTEEKWHPLVPFMVFDLSVGVQFRRWGHSSMWNFHSFLRIPP